MIMSIKRKIHEKTNFDLLWYAMCFIKQSHILLQYSFLVFNCFSPNEMFSLSFTTKLVSFYFDGKGIWGGVRALTLQLKGKQVSSMVFVWTTYLLLKKFPLSLFTFFSQPTSCS